MGKKSAVLESATACCMASRPRDRIMTAARDLFHKHGIRAVGVDTIAEAAGTNKMTLYRHFGSKDDLICECLRGLAAEKDMNWNAIAARHGGDPMAQLRAWVRFGGECLGEDVRGCDFVNATIELTEADHPARKLIESLMSVWHERLVALCAACGIAQPDMLADTLYLLFDGARVSRQAVGAEGPSARYVRLAEAAITAFSSAEVQPSREARAAL